jgi:hypothetical protein
VQFALLPMELARQRRSLALRLDDTAIALHY